MTDNEIKKYIQWIRDEKDAAAQLLGEMDENQDHDEATSGSIKYWTGYFRALEHAYENSIVVRALLAEKAETAQKERST